MAKLFQIIIHFYVVAELFVDRHVLEVCLGVMSLAAFTHCFQILISTFYFCSLLYLFLVTEQTFIH